MFKWNIKWPNWRHPANSSHIVSSLQTNEKQTGGFVLSLTLWSRQVALMPENLSSAYSFSKWRARRLNVNETLQVELFRALCCFRCTAWLTAAETPWVPPSLPRDGMSNLRAERYSVCVDGGDRATVTWCGGSSCHSRSALGRFSDLPLRGGHGAAAAGRRDGRRMLYF